jgi:hypothetical protein
MASTPDYDVGYADQGTALLLKADLGRSWRKRTNAFGFSGQKKIYYKRAWHIRTLLNLFVKRRLPNSPINYPFIHLTSEDDRLEAFPDISLETGDGLISYSLSKRLLTMKIALTEEQPWRTMSTGHVGLYIEKPFLFATPSFCFDLQAFVVFHEPPAMKPPDVREWSQKFFVPGGQFESNRRRH